jgi:hypothetical protein
VSAVGWDRGCLLLADSSGSRSKLESVLQTGCRHSHGPVECRRLTKPDLGVFPRERPVYLRNLTFADIVDELAWVATDDQDDIVRE